MRHRAAMVVALVSAALAPAALAQQGGWRGTPPGRFPSGPPHGPAAAHPQPAPVQPSPTHQEQAQPVPRPFVDGDARWVGHGGETYGRYRLERPWARGRFRGPMGHGHVHRLAGWDAPLHRFRFSSSFFLIAEPDWPWVSDWDWNGDQIVLYDDPDHPGWYLAYNVRLGTYVHVQYDGAF